MHRLSLVIIGFLILAPIACVEATEPQSVSSAQEVRYDHHVHLLSSDLVRDWKSLGVPFSRPDSFYSSASVLLDERKIEKAIILSMAYLYGSEWFQRLESASEKERAWVSRENDFIASVARSAPDRLAGFYSVNPIRPYAIEEIRRCLNKPELTGLKLHLYNSQVSLTNKVHLERMKEIFDLASKNRVPVLIHINAIDSDSRKKEVNTLVNELIATHPNMEIYIAHLGGSGGYGSRAGEVLKAFIDHLRPGGKLESSAIFFELSAVALRESSEGVEPPDEAQLRQLAIDLRNVGLHRILFGSDHPVFNSQEYARTLREKLLMSEKEIQQIISNEAPVLKRLRK